MDLSRYVAWCDRHLDLLAARSADIEMFARDLEAAGKARATVTRPPSAIAGLYEHAVEEDLPGHSPAVHVRRPRIDFESRATGLGRNEVGALLVAAGLGTAAEHALILCSRSMVCGHPEATGASTEAMGGRARAPAPGNHR